MSHPESCKNPDTCTLSYREHLVGFVLGASAIPSRAIHRTPGQVDEPAWRTEARERRWEADMPAFKRMHDAGRTPEHIDGSAELERSLGG